MKRGSSESGPLMLQRSWMGYEKLFHIICSHYPKIAECLKKDGAHSNPLEHLPQPCLLDS